LLGERVLLEFCWGAPPPMKVPHFPTLLFFYLSFFFLQNAWPEVVCWAEDKWYDCDNHKVNILPGEAMR
jgi:hypothetical protein